MNVRIRSKWFSVVEKFVLDVSDIDELHLACASSGSLMKLIRFVYADYFLI